MPGTNPARLRTPLYMDAEQVHREAVVLSAHADMQLPNAEDVLSSVLTVLKKGERSAARSHSDIMGRGGSTPRQETLCDDEKEAEEESADTMHASEASRSYPLERAGMDMKIPALSSHGRRTRVLMTPSPQLPEHAGTSNISLKNLQAVLML